MIKRLISDEKVEALNKIKDYKNKDKKNLSRQEIDDLVVLIAEYLNII